MAGIYVTEDRLLAFEVSTPYFQSPLALFMPRERAEGFTTRAKILEYPALKIGVFNDRFSYQGSHALSRTLRS
jgi:hypothetical protein